MTPFYTANFQAEFYIVALINQNIQINHLSVYNLVLQNVLKYYFAYRLDFSFPILQVTFRFSQPGPHFRFLYGLHFVHLPVTHLASLVWGLLCGCWGLSLLDGSSFDRLMVTKFLSSVWLPVIYINTFFRHEINR